MQNNEIKIPIQDWLDQFENLTDRMLVSDKCWSDMSVKSRFWNYAQMVSHGKYHICEADKASYSKLVESIEKKRCIVIWGPPGTGKSTITRIISKITYHLADPKRFKFINSYHLANHFAQQGSEVFGTYTNGNWIFDDVGLEKNMQIKGGGSSYNVFEQLLYQLCDLHFSHKQTFILSTNLDEAQLLERYGERVMSRLNQVADFIKINGTDHRTKDIRIEVFPEVIHQPKGEEGTPMPEYFKTDFEKLVKKFSIEKVKEKRAKPLQPTEFEMLCWDWFDASWKKQGELRMNGGSNYIVYEAKELDRQGFVAYLKETYKPSESLPKDLTPEK